MCEQVTIWPPQTCPMCGNELRCAWVYTAPPEGETPFDLGGAAYHREIHQCQVCGHFVSICDFDLSRLYEGAYVDATYGRKGLRQTFERIIALPPEKSDNMGRVKRILEFADQSLKLPGLEGRAPRLLDVGSGLGIFPYRIRQEGWQVTAIDPDPKAVEHIREVGQQVGGIEVVCDDFMQTSQLGQYDLITFNKVLEHVIDPVEMLSKGVDYLNPKGYMYVELPDGEMASGSVGFSREEFFVEHHHIFSAASIALLSRAALRKPLTITRIQESSSKYTFFAYL